MPKNIIVAQSGGPSAAINATLAGIIETAVKSEQVGKIYGGFHGVEGILAGKIIDITAQIKGPEDIDALALTPCMALHSCRYKVPDPSKDEGPFAKILRTCKALDVGFFFYIGGNDSMDTAQKLSVYFLEKGEDIKCIGFPKTIDNDLPETDHTPGFGSAVKYVATSMVEIQRDNRMYPSKAVVVVEVMGRDAGWLTAGSAIAHVATSAPHLIYVPEVPFDPEECVAAVKKLHETIPHIIIAVSEGIKDKDGHYYHLDNLGGAVDSFGHAQLTGAGHSVGELIKKHVGCRVRSIELSLLQRSAGHIHSAVDLRESRQVGHLGTELALKGETGKFAAIRRISGGVEGEYKSDIIAVDLIKVAALVRPLPLEWLKADKTGLTPAGMDYFLPLIQGDINPPTRLGLPFHFEFKPDFITIPQ